MTDESTETTNQDQPVSSLVANNPSVQNDPNSSDAMRKQVEDELKAELLRDLSLDDVRNLVTMAKSGYAGGMEAPNTFDDLDRNFARMVRRVQRMSPGGTMYWEERPMVRTLQEAIKEHKDWYDPINKVWIREGRKREKDYPENTVEFWTEHSAQIGAKS